MLTANFFLALDHKIDIHWQIAFLLQRFLDSNDVRKNLSFVVRCAARKNVTVFQHRLERRRVPQLERIRRLNIIMAVDQNRRSAGAMFVTRPNDRMTCGRDHF